MAHTNYSHIQDELDIDSYKNALNSLAQDGSDFVFPNKGAAHAAAVVSTIFTYASAEVRIYATDMNGDISNQKGYKESLQNYLRKGSVLKVLLDKKPERQSDGTFQSGTLNFIESNLPTGIKAYVKVADSSFQKEMISIARDGKTLYHFATGDDKMVRIESDSATHAAPFCSFNQPSLAMVLNHAFDRGFTKGTQLFE